VWDESFSAQQTYLVTELRNRIQRSLLCREEIIWRYEKRVFVGNG